MVPAANSGDEQSIPLPAEASIPAPRLVTTQPQAVSPPSMDSRQPEPHQTFEAGDAMTGVCPQPFQEICSPDLGSINPPVRFEDLAVRTLTCAPRPPPGQRRSPARTSKSSRSTLPSPHSLAVAEASSHPALAVVQSSVKQSTQRAAVRRTAVEVSYRALHGTYASSPQSSSQSSRRSDVPPSSHSRSQSPLRFRTQARSQGRAHQIVPVKVVARPSQESRRSRTSRSLLDPVKVATVAVKVAAAAVRVL
ncbi:hypothetical protein BJ508DRAFT_334823 [Ascobolus immersus RN42]|uniref:Uncharacterized protein n=1 Tax=Ascobolus immersus RN42 TaxID=1160509 RepID=A0A3N4HEK6_ASCIM|nr:hypothetical protein BJ508DRAFT_334823 [Ascobolus immersus RN42]